MSRAKGKIPYERNEHRRFFTRRVKRSLTNICFYFLLNTLCVCKLYVALIVFHVCKIIKSLKIKQL
nr:MAG TPA: hypothetical protein [Caudoviricetes sp.]